MQRFCVILLSFIFVSGLFSCKDDGIDAGEVTDYTVNKWIEETLRENYYWYEDIPASNKINYNTDPESFFKSLLSSKDGKPKDAAIGHQYYSVIESSTSSSTRIASAGTDVSLGFEYQYYLVTNINREALKVLYIIPDSPAANSNLKRGDWIYEINDQEVNQELVNSLNNGSNMKLGVSEDSRPVVTKNVILKAQQVDDNPVYLSKTIDYNGKKIGYLVYNHFTKGKGEDDSTDETYDNALRKAMSSFKTDMPDEFVLDLRYNSGGLVTSAQLLATMLCPQSILGEVFCKITYNDKKTSKNRSLTFDKSIIDKNGGGANLNLSRLFIITSRRTASASEAVINGLKPFLGDNLILIGEKTEGKNVGSLTYKDNRFSWILHPIVCLIANKDDYSGYSDGFYPDLEYAEPAYNLYELGDTDEYILNKVLDNITNNTTNRVAESVEEPDLVLLGSSLDKKGKSMIIPSDSKE